MDKLNLPFYYELGQRLHALTEIVVPYGSDPVLKFPLAFAAITARPHIEAVLKVHGITVSKFEGFGLLTAMSKLDAWDYTKQELEPTQRVEANDIIERAKRFETIVLAELQSVAAYIVSPKGIYSTAALIASAEDMFPLSVKAKLGSDVVEEVRQAGRCLAFDTPTASGFHAMRATEAVMHSYYVVVCKPVDDVKHLDNWGAYISEFRKVSDGDVQEVVALLQQIKDLHRNLIMHPEVVLTPDEAFTLFELSKGAIMAMAGRLAPQAPPPAMPLSPE